ncbi:MAG: phosphomannomutase [Gemmatimonadales bacterium]|nr:Phosphomannomutase/phosphoglucomutase [bacterium HR33]GIW51135.1 MAG: phosphomannomutase [Gemmatimonadales bacterium]
MKVPAVVFRQYDVRGVVGEQLTPELAHAIGRAFATWVTRRLGRSPRIAVGRDNRPSGELLARAVRDGIAAAQGTAVDVGQVPTPALYLAVVEIGVDAGLQVTGSHNPPEFNGFKMVIGKDPVYGDAIQELRRLIEGGDLVHGPGTIEADRSVLDRYVKAVVSRNGPLMRPVKVVVDCGNGVASLVAERILRELGAEVVGLYCESDGTFPNHHPDPTVLENLRDLQDKVREVGAELGIGFDGDGDRIGVVDERGEVVYGDILLLLLARDLVERNGRGHPVIFDVKCSDILSRGLEEIGLKPVMWKTGHSLLKAKMKELGAPLAGEMSGHMFFGADYYGFDDALFAAARLLAYLSRREGPLSRLLVDVPRTFTTPEIRIDCPDERKFEVAERAAQHFGARYEVVTLDGVRISFPEGWGLLRASNTQPVLVLRFEATSPEALAAYRAEVEEWLRSEGVMR